MKTISRLFLFLAVLCLTGCSGEEQTVAFSVHEINSPNDAESYTVGVSANCPWLIYDDKNRTYTDNRTGEGDAEVRITVYSNTTTEDQTYRVTIQSRDGTSSDVLVINQEAWKETVAGKTTTIPAEGCEFSVDILTNDEVKDMQLPEWISFVSSRSLSEHVYTFKAEPNRTGKERSGTITLHGKDSSGSTTVTQKPYYPTGIEMDGLDNVFLADGNTYSFPIKPVPEYAATSGLEASMSAGNASIEDGNLLVQCSVPGTHTLKITHYGNTIYTKDITFVSPEISLNVSDGAEYCIGQPFEITADIPQEYAEISVSDETILKKTDGKYVFTKEGEAEITARNILSGKETKIHVYSSYITFPDISSSIVQIGSYSLLSCTAGVNVYDTESYTIYTTVGTGNERFTVKQGTLSGTGTLSSVSYSCELKGNFNQEDVRIHVETVTSNGEKKTKSIHL